MVSARAVRHDVRFAVRCAVFVWFVLLGASIAEWRELHDRRRSDGRSPSLLHSNHESASARVPTHS